MDNSGGYKSLPFFKQAEIIYDFTIEFVKKYINPYSRTKDQMEQAARSGKQNIPEGYLQKSLEGRIKLLGVARGSLEELLNDYIDFLRAKLCSLRGKGKLAVAKRKVDKPKKIVVPEKIPQFGRGKDKRGRFLLEY